jgi:hypothetical protein
MKEILDINEIASIIIEHKPGPVNKLTSTNYPDKVDFQCGCGKIHRVNDGSLKIFAISPIVKFYFVCNNNFVSLVKVSGFFSQKANTIATFKKKLFKEYFESIGLDVGDRL